MKVNIGDSLRLKRLEKRQSQGDIAKRVGVSAVYISGIENGSQTNPKDEIIVKLAEVFDINEDELFFEFNKIPLSARNEINEYPSLAKALSQLNHDKSMSHKKKKEFYDKLVYWYKKIAEEDDS
jgi:transcriptional regulator with XRE-family HTH domain